MGFIAVLVLTTLAIAGSAAFFSVYGLANIFEGAFWPVVIMATSLEAGKLVAASYVYRFWDNITFLMKAYLITAILVLMLITSAGIFGYLSAAYQQDSIPLKEMQTQIQLIDDRKKELNKLKQERYDELARLDAQIDAIPGNHSTNRRKMRQAQQDQRDNINADLKKYNAEIDRITQDQHKLKNQVIKQEAHTGPIVFIAKAMGNDIDDATKWMIFLIIFAFDPLAVALTIGTNNVMLRRQSEKKEKEEKDHQEEIHKEELDFELRKEAAKEAIVKEAEEKMAKAEQMIADAAEMAEVAHEEAERIRNEERAKLDQHRMETRPEIAKPVMPGVPVQPVQAGEPEPKVDSVEQLKGILDEMNSKKELTPAEKEEKSMIEEMLAKKHVKEKIRNPNANS